MFTVRTGDPSVIESVLRCLSAFANEAPYNRGALLRCLQALWDGNRSLALQTASDIVTEGYTDEPGNFSLIGTGHIRFVSPSNEPGACAILSSKTDHEAAYVIVTDVEPHIAERMLRALGDALGDETVLRFAKEPPGDEPLPEMPVYEAIVLIRSAA